MQEVIAHRGKTNRNPECTPGYYNFEGEFNRRQDGNYNGGFPKYYAHLGGVREEIERHFAFNDVSGTVRAERMGRAADRERRRRGVPVDP